MALPQSAIQTRREIIETAARDPGVPLAQVAALLALDYSTTLRHARALQKRGALIIDDDGPRALFRPGAARLPRSAATPRALRALLAVQAGAGTPALLARELGLTRGGAGSMLDALERRGLVRREASWRVVSERAAVALAQGGRSAG